MFGWVTDLLELAVGLWNYFRDKTQQEIGAEKQENADLEASAKTEDAELEAAVNRPSDAALDDKLLHHDF
jgi:hypothetical protein